MRQAARDTAELLRGSGAAPGGRVRVAVNVSARQFPSPDLITDLAAAMADAGVEPGAIIVELTESALIARQGGAMADLDALKQLGVALAIDDFGTGYSSLSYLQDLPFDGLKIDKSFIDEIATSARRAELIRGIVRIADTVGLYVVGEGVETREQSELLAAAGCQFGQGYYFSRPVPFEDARRLVDSGQFAG
jgi:EAL domain-containing protein (putative c-di-GMP-specific phosphodiesterase class I)